MLRDLFNFLARGQNRKVFFTKNSAQKYDDVKQSMNIVNSQSCLTAYDL